MADVGAPFADYDFAVVGGGPCGLAIAIGLRRAFPAARIVVFDKARALRPIGAALTIPTNGQAALGAISPAALAAVKEKALKVNGFQMRDHENQVIKSVATTPESQTRPQDLIISWFGLQQVLLGQLGSQFLQLNKSLTRLSQSDDTGLISLTFQDHTSVTAHVVIGADGNMSATRSALFPDEGPPEYVGGAIWRTMVQPVPEDLDLPVGYTAIWHSAEGPTRRLGMRNFGDHLSVTALASWPKEKLHELYRRSYYSEDGEGIGGEPAPDHRARRVQQVLSQGLPDRITTLLTKSDSSALIEHGLYWRDPSKPWVKGHVALAGDAAHVMPPTMGQGTAAAFEDAYHFLYILAEAVSDQKDDLEVSALEIIRRGRELDQDIVADALKEYQAKMQRRVGVLSRGTLTREATCIIKRPENLDDEEVLDGMALHEFMVDRGGPFAPLFCVEEAGEGDLPSPSLPSPTINLKPNIPRPRGTRKRSSVNGNWV